MDTPQCTRVYENHHLASPRWREYETRPGDVLVATAYKSGTTWMQTIVANLIFQDCNNRLIQTLIRFSHSAAATPAGDEVVLRITHHQLAQAVGVARETVSLALTQLRHRNLLRTGRNQLTFNPEALRQFKNNCGKQVQNVG